LVVLIVGPLIVTALVIAALIVAALIVATLIVAALVITTLIIASLIVTSLVVAALIIAALIVSALVVTALVMSSLVVATLVVASLIVTSAGVMSSLIIAALVITALIVASLIVTSLVVSATTLVMSSIILFHRSAIPALWLAVRRSSTTLVGNGCLVECGTFELIDTLRPEPVGSGGFVGDVACGIDLSLLLVQLFLELIQLARAGIESLSLGNIDTRLSARGFWYNGCGLDLVEIIGDLCCPGIGTMCAAIRFLVVTLHHTGA